MIDAIAEKNMNRFKELVINERNIDGVNIIYRMSALSACAVYRNTEAAKILLFFGVRSDLEFAYMQALYMGQFDLAAVLIPGMEYLEMCEQAVALRKRYRDVMDIGPQ